MRLSIVVILIIIIQIVVLKSVSKYFDSIATMDMSLAGSGRNEWAEEPRSISMEKKCSSAVDKLVDCECTVDGSCRVCYVRFTFS